MPDVRMIVVVANPVSLIILLKQKKNKRRVCYSRKMSEDPPCSGADWFYDGEGRDVQHN